MIYEICKRATELNDDVDELIKEEHFAEAVMDIAKLQTLYWVMELYVREVMKNE